MVQHLPQLYTLMTWACAGKAGAARGSHLEEWIHMEDSIVASYDGQALESCPSGISQQGQ